MCDFKPGDEVVWVPPFAGEGDPYYGLRPRDGILRQGQVYIVSWTGPNPFALDDPIVTLVGVRSTHRTGGFSARRFRKVQKRNDRLTIEAFHQSVWPGELGYEFVSNVTRSIPWREDGPKGAIS